MFPELTIQCHPKWLWKFNALLQKGVTIQCLTNRSLMLLLKEDFHLDDNYIHHRIQTITIDGRPVDDPASAMIPNGTTLAISGAMPGLVGATLRKGGYYAAMRETISYASHDKATRKTQVGFVIIKLFNLILKDLAEAFLRRGIGITGKALVALMDEGMTLSADQFGPVAEAGDVLEWATVREHYLDMALVSVVVKPTYPPATGGNTPRRSPARKS